MANPGVRAEFDSPRQIDEPTRLRTCPTRPIRPERLPERGAAAERLLLREFSHRINNELASAIGLISVAAHRCNQQRSQVRRSRRSGITLECYAHVQHFAANAGNTARTSN